MCIYIYVYVWVLTYMRFTVTPTPLPISSSENSVIIIGGGLAGVSAGKNDGCYIVLVV